MSNTVAQFLSKANGDSSGTWPWPGPKKWRIRKRKILQSHVIAPPRRNRNTPTGAPRRAISPRPARLCVKSKFLHAMTTPFRNNFPPLASRQPTILGWRGGSKHQAKMVQCFESSQKKKNSHAPSLARRISMGGVGANTFATCSKTMILSFMN